MPVGGNGIDSTVRFLVWYLALQHSSFFFVVSPRKGGVIYDSRYRHGMRRITPRGVPQVGLFRGTLVLSVISAVRTPLRSGQQHLH